MEKTKLFVYGSLARTGSRHEILEDKLDAGLATFNGTTWLEGFELYRLPDYPVAVPAEDSVYGELYSIPASFLTSTLDKIEGFPHNFDRKQVQVEGDTCWIYYQPHPPEEAKKITSGRWRPGHEEGEQ